MNWVADAAGLRPGQRVRLTIEGTVERTPLGSLSITTCSDFYLILAYGEGDGQTIARWITESGHRIEVLAEPRPDEPTGLGAVVEAAGLRWVRVETRPDLGRLGYWWTPNAAINSERWDGIPDPITVLSPGWEPTP